MLFGRNGPFISRWKHHCNFHTGLPNFWKHCRCVHSVCTWTHHSSKLAQQHGLGLQCRSTDLRSSLKQTIWNDPRWNGRWSSVVSLWDLCCRHGTAESNLREVFGQSAARIQPANQSSAPEPPRPRRYLWDNRRWEKSAFHLPSFKWGSERIT